MFAPFRFTKYTALTSSQKDGRDSGCLEDGESLEVTENHSFLPQAGTKASRHQQRHQYWHLGCELLLLLCNLAMLAYILFPLRSSVQKQQKECGKLLGQWLPGWEDGVEYEVQQFKGSFGLQSAYTGVGPQVDAAWDNITDGPTGGAIGITQEQWEAVNPFHEYPVMLDEDRGTGRYLASLDVFHQLHCVDLLRKSIHREYYDKHEGSFAGAPQRVVEGHLEHCIETLRQTLMCHGDISLLTYNWVDGRDMPYPNFNTIHTCKKWDTLTDWNMGHDVSIGWRNGKVVKEYMPPMKPKGIVGMKVPP